MQRWWVGALQWAEAAKVLAGLVRVPFEEEEAAARGVLQRAVGGWSPLLGVTLRWWEQRGAQRGAPTKEAREARQAARASG